MSDLIGPDGLEADAVVPQCLDNQYVSDKIFADMIKRRVDYRDRKIMEARERSFRAEFTRSLVYSSQVIIQRAYLKNSDFLYKNYQPGNGQDLRAFAELIRQHAIVPFLYRESSLTDDLEFDIRSEGDSATQALLEEVGENVRCVRLATDDADNARATESMTTSFGASLIRLNNLGSAERNAMAAELFTDPRVLQEAGAWQKFEAAIDSFTDYSYNKMRECRKAGKKITRQDIYQDYFAMGSADGERARNVPLGRFKAPNAEEPFLLELKKFVDLVYNVNLPDHLKRYTFTPASMPSRIALQDAPGVGYGHEQVRSSIGNSEAMEWIARSFMARTETAMNLPLLSDLTIDDALTVRQLPEWAPFKESQTRILEDPLHCLSNLPQFEEAFNEFQGALSNWYNRTYKRDQTINRYSNFVSLALSIGGALVLAGSPITGIPHAAADIAIPGLMRAIPRKVKGYAAKLMVGVYDLEKSRLDTDRSYTIELMQANEELLRDDIIELLNSVAVRPQATALPYTASGFADQGFL